MFLIYNFHLHEAKNQKLVKDYLEKIKLTLNRDLTDQDLYEISVYGLESFFYASLKTLNETHLFEGWKKMSHLWTLINEKKIVEIIQSQDEQKYLIKLEESIRLNDYFKIAISFDHLLKIYKETDGVSGIFISYCKNIFPFITNF